MHRLILYSCTAILYYTVLYILNIYCTYTACRRESSAMHTTKRRSNYERHRAAPDLVSEALGAYVASFCNIIAESGGPANIPPARRCIISIVSYSCTQPITTHSPNIPYLDSPQFLARRFAWSPRSPRSTVLSRLLAKGCDSGGC